MAGALDALASYVTSMLTDMAKEEVAMLLGVSSGINDLSIKLRDLKNFLADADRRNITDESVQVWVAELKRAMYQATDIIDLCQLKVMEQSPSKDMGCLNPLLFCMRNPLHAHDIGTRIKSLSKQLDDICKRGRSFSFIKLEAYHDRKMAPPHGIDRKTHPLLERSAVVGEKIEDDTRALVEMLTKDITVTNDGIMVFAIVGVGGIGKTTLSKKVFNDEAIQGKFSKKIWLSVTQEFNEVELLRTAITAADGNMPGPRGESKDIALLVPALASAIKDKKFFLVLDDLWENGGWDNMLKPPFSHSAPSSRVLITTRHGSVARGMKAMHPYHHVEKLGSEDGWSLLKKQEGKERPERAAPPPPLLWLFPLSSSSSSLSRPGPASSSPATAPPPPPLRLQLRPPSSGTPQDFSWGESKCKEGGMDGSYVGSTTSNIQGVLDALASYVASMLAEMAKEEVAMLIGVSGEIKDLSIKLGDLKNFLADADRRNITDESVRRWVGELKRAMYLATDILNLCQLKAMEQGASKDMGCLNPLLFCMRNPLHSHGIGTRIKELNKELDNICERGNKFQFAKLEAYQDWKTAQSLAVDRKTDSLMERSSAVGEKIEEDTRALVELLTREVGSDKTGHLIVVGIVGVGGIGKTTLGKKVFNDEAIKDKFTRKIWLSITQAFTDVELLSTAITAAGGDLPKGGGVRDRALLVDALKNAIEDKKFFLVLDDLWEANVWKKLLITPFGYGGPGSRVLITTRHETITRNLKVAHCHYVDNLAREDAWPLLKKQVLTTEETGHEVDVIKDLGLQITEKCDGLPLAIKVMGVLLCNKEKSRRDWEDVLNDDIWSVSPMSDELNYAIYLSYQDLPPYLKQCFLHFSLIPKKALLPVSEIVSMWICEGLVQGGSNSLEKEGTKNYKELILRNLIEVDPSYPSQFTCDMHDVIRSFAQFMTKDETLVGNNGDTAKTNLRSPNFLRLSIETKGVGSDEFEWRYLRQQKLLRTLILTGNLKIQPGDSFMNFPTLRLLYIESANIAALTECVCQLKHLRYLSLKRTDMCTLPENICEMKFLQHISLENCGSFVKLPDSIIMLQGLRYLDIEGTRVNSIPKGFRALTNLRVLCGFPAYTDGACCSLEELGSLSQLNLLSLESLDNVSNASLAAKARVNEKKDLIKLVLKCGDGLVQGGVSESKEEEQIIEAVFDVLCPQPCIEHIVIERYFGRRLPGWMTSTAMVPLESLKILVLQQLSCCTQLPDGLCRLPYLEWLQVDNAPVIKCVGPEFVQQYNQRPRPSSQLAATFPKLQKLSFFVMEEWKEWVWEAEVKAMRLCPYWRNFISLLANWAICLLDLCLMQWL